MQVALLQTGAWGLCALAIFQYQDVSSFFFSFLQDGGGGQFWKEENQ